MTHEVQTQLEALLKRAAEETFKGKVDQAEHIANEVLAALGKDHNKDLVSEKIRANALFRLADVERRRSNYDAALERAHELLTIACEFQIPELNAKAWNTIGIVHKNLGNYDEALLYMGKALDVFEEIGKKSSVALVTGNCGSVHLKLGNYDKALEYMGKALAAHEELGEKSDVARIIGNIGLVHKDLGNYDKALEYYSKALAAHVVLGEKSAIANVTGNIGSVQMNLVNYDKALEYYGKALAGHEELNEKSRVATVTGNIGIVHYNLGNYEKALEYHGKALASYIELGMKEGVAGYMGNIGSVHQSLGNYNKALEYFGKALAAHEELGVKSGVAIVTGNIGSLYATTAFEGHDARKAEEYLIKAIGMGTEIGVKANLVMFHKTLSELFEKVNQCEDAFVHYKKYIEIEKELNLEEAKKQDSIREQRKAIEIAIASAEAKHQATQELLHNVLPPTIANRMVTGEKIIAEKLPRVSVLFADIVGFTKLSQRITPEELVDGLDRIFSAFDALAEKYGLEKIKTIGDAYMVVSGAPLQRDDHAEAMAQFALEMLGSIKEFRSISTGEEIQIRIGIHSGEVVAGVIGKKKFAYDLWGDAVNTASRMESHGEPGKIHVSEEFKQAFLLGTGRQGQPQKSPTSPMSPLFTNRGEIDIKGKGKMKTYFLEKKSNV